MEAAGAAAAAVLMAVAAIEAALSEYSTYLSVPSSAFRHLPQADLQVIRDGSEGLHTRYQRLITFYNPTIVCDTHEPFKNLRCLLELRHAIAHRRAAFLVPGDWPEGLRECRARIPYHSDGVHDWTSVVLIPKVAAWAVDATNQFFDWVRPIMPTLSVRVRQRSRGPPSNMRLKLTGAGVGRITLPRRRAPSAAPPPCARGHCARSLSAIR